jgi:hypothetical protein
MWKPVDVGQDFEYLTALDTFVAWQCRLLYLNSRPSEREAARIYPSIITHSTSLLSPSGGDFARHSRPQSLREMGEWKLDRNGRSRFWATDLLG